MRNIKRVLGTTVLAMSVLTTSVLGCTTAFAKEVQYDKSLELNSRAHAIGDIVITKEQKEQMEKDGKVIKDAKDLQSFFNETNNSYFNNVKRGRKVSSAADNSKSKYMPSIGDQGQIGSCSSWAMTYLQASYTLNRARDLDGKDTKNILSPMWTYNLTNEGANNGTTLVDVVSVLSEIGAVSIEDVKPYTTTTNTSQYGDLHARNDLWLKAQDNKISDAFMVDIKNDSEKTPITSPDDEDLDTIKMLLDSGEVLSCSTPAYKWRITTIKENEEVPGNEKHVGEQIVSRCDGYQYGGHRIAIVGYDDDIWVDINQNGKVEEGEKGAFKIANSWGTLYGNDGYLWFSYDSVNKVSSVIEGSAINLSRYRDASLIQIVAMTAKDDSTKSNSYVQVTMNSAAANTIKVDITATDKNGKKYTYGVAPFKSSNMYYSVGAYGFDGTRNATDGTFVFDLANAIEGLTANEINDYKWSLKFTDTTNDSKSLIVKDVKILDTLNNVEYASNLNSEITLNGASQEVSFK